jgi:hypothetical protein
VAIVRPPALTQQCVEQYQMTKPRPDAWLAGPRGTKSTMMSCIAATPHASYSGASPLRKVRHYSLIFMRGSLDTMPNCEACSERLSDKVFTGEGC